jgi:diacylglycerol kinase (ATP)
MQCLVIHNQNAGWGEHSKKAINAALELAGASKVRFATKDIDLSKIDLSDIDVVVAAGGDGTVAKIASSITRQDVSLAILPLGTANNIARSLGVVGNLLDITENLKLSRWRPLDVGLLTTANGQRSFVETFGVGCFASLLKKGSLLKTRGPEQIRDGRKLLAKIVKKARKLDIYSANAHQHFDEDLLAVEVTNIPYVGPGLCLANNANPGDGFFDIITLPVQQRQAFIDWLHYPIEYPAPVSVHRCAELVLRFSNAPSRIDDVYFKSSAQPSLFKIKMKSNAVKALIPDNSMTNFLSGRR